MSDSTPESETEFARLTTSVEATRAQLFDTLDAIEDKLNVPKQLGKAGHRVRHAFDENPKPFLAAFAGGVLVVGGIVVSVVRRH